MTKWGTLLREIRLIKSIQISINADGTCSQKKEMLERYTSGGFRIIGDLVHRHNGGMNTSYRTVKDIPYIGILARPERADMFAAISRCKKKTALCV